MKTKSCSLFVVMLLSASLYGQPAKFGFTIAGNSANWCGTDAKAFASNLEQEIQEYSDVSGNFCSKARLAFSVGFYCDLPLFSVIRLQPEVNYVQRGSKLSGNLRVGVLDYYWGGKTYDIKTEFVFKCDYIELPLLVKLCTKGKGDRVSLYAGPAFSLLMSSKVKVKVSLDGESDEATTDFPGFSGNDVGFIVGAAAELANGIIWGLRYYNGARDIVTDSDMRNRAFTAYVGVAF